MSDSNGIPTSELGVQTFPKGEHPRDIRKEGKNVDPTLKGAYEAWLKGQDVRTQKLAKESPERAAEVFRSSLNAYSPEDFYKLVGIEHTTDEEDESVAANTGSGIATAEKTRDDARTANKKENEKKSGKR